MGMAIGPARDSRSTPCLRRRRRRLTGRKSQGEVAARDLAEVKTSPMQAVSVATALIGRGLQSDRYVAKVGAFCPARRNFGTTISRSLSVRRWTLRRCQMAPTSRQRKRGATLSHEVSTGMPLSGASSVSDRYARSNSACANRACISRGSLGLKWWRD
jgi:hypothetical protein